MKGGGVKAGRIRERSPTERDGFPIATVAGGMAAEFIGASGPVDSEFYLLPMRFPR